MRGKVSAMWHCTCKSIRVQAQHVAKCLLCGTAHASQYEYKVSVADLRVSASEVVGLMNTARKFCGRGWSMFSSTRGKVSAMWHCTCKSIRVQAQHVAKCLLCGTAHASQYEYKVSVADLRDVLMIGGYNDCQRIRT
ncbi:hypothetical protein J6590_068870 [Homalodisca vitripennis]|nr:hypothetical protein J6590_068870 [Homalodisca vitripennis]